MARETQPRVAAAPPPTPPMSASTEPASAVRFLEPRVGPIEKATDLGSVQVLKHGNMFLLTDQFGDIHSDSRHRGVRSLNPACPSLRIKYDFSPSKRRSRSLS